MLTYDRLTENPAVLRAYTGLSIEEFESLLPAFERAWEAHLQANLTNQPDRKRKPGAGRKARLASAADKLVFILHYTRNAPRQVTIGHLFDLSQGQVSVWAKRLAGVLQTALAALEAENDGVLNGGLTQSTVLSSTENGAGPPPHVALHESQYG